MKTKISLPTFICALLLFSINGLAQEHSDEKIVQVENGLSHASRIKGDSTWSIEERMKHYGVPGMSLAVIHDGKVVWTKAYGVKDRNTNEPVTTDTLFQCASISKPVSSVAALRMVELGNFKLEEDVNQYLSSWKIPENEFTKDKKVTLKHLVSHTGGLTVHGFGGYSPGEPVPTLLELLDGTSPSNSGAIKVDKIPGESFRYSGGGYCVMQQMMIEKTGKAFPDIMNEMVLSRLEMSKSTFEQPLPPSRLKEAATGYLPNGEMVRGKRHTYPEMAPAGLWSTSEEMASFLIELQKAYQGESEKVLSQTMAKKMLDEQLGIFVRKRGDETYFGHGGWNEGFSSESSAHLSNGTGIVVLTNANQPPFINEVINSVAHVYDWPNLGAEYTALELDADAISKLKGRYNLQGELVKVFTRDEKLFFQKTGATPSELICIEANKYVRRESADAVCFSLDQKSGKWQFAFRTPGDSQSESKIVGTRLADDEKLPIELLESGDVDKSVAAYLEAKQSNPTQESLQETYLNEFGYELLNQGQNDFALRVFQLNTKLYPNGFNTWDSLAEMYMNSGDTEKAIKYYEKSVELNPDNAGAIAYLKKLKSSK